MFLLLIQSFIISQYPPFAPPTLFNNPFLFNVPIFLSIAVVLIPIFSAISLLEICGFSVIKLRIFFWFSTNPSTNLSTNPSLLTSAAFLLNLVMKIPATTSKSVSGSFSMNSIFAYSCKIKDIFATNFVALSKTSCNLLSV